MSVLSWFGRRASLKDSGFWAAFYGGGSKAGKTVSETTALRLSAAWACVRLISQTISTLPLGVFERGPNGRRKAIDDLWLSDILRSPNADQTPVEYFEGLAGALCLRGNHFARKEGLRSNGEFSALETMHPDRTTPRREGRELFFDWIDPDGRRVVLPQREVFHVKGFGLGGDLGLSPLSCARETLGTAIAAEEVAARMFASGMQSSGFLTVEQELKKNQRTDLEKIMADFVGSTNAGKMMILEAGMKYSPLSMKPEEAQLLTTRGFHVEEICRWFGVPPVLVGHASAGQTMWGSGIEQIFLGWLTLGLRPYLVRTEQAVAKRLFGPVERRKFYVEFNVEGLQRADSAGRAALWSSLSQNGVMTRNEIREKENLPSMEGGDELTVQSNLVPLGALGQSPPVDAAARQALLTWLGDRPGIENHAPKQSLLPGS